jgi:hypothetical protein
MPKLEAPLPPFQQGTALYTIIRGFIVQSRETLQDMAVETRFSTSWLKHACTDKTLTACTAKSSREKQLLSNRNCVKPSIF